MGFTALLPVLLAVLALIGAAVGAMIVMQRLSGRCLQGGTCASRRVLEPDGADLSCASCPNRRTGAATSPRAPPTSAV